MAKYHWGCVREGAVAVAVTEHVTIIGGCCRPSVFNVVDGVVSGECESREKCCSCGSDWCECMHIGKGVVWPDRPGAFLQVRPRLVLWQFW